MRVKIIVFTLIVSFGLGLFATAYARNRFWPGVAAGVGAAIVLGHIIHPPRYHYPDRYYDRYPDRYYAPPVVYAPPPSAYAYPHPTYNYTYREQWVPGHWEESYNQGGYWERVWIPGYWQRGY